MHARVADKLNLSLDYSHGKGDSNTVIDGVSAGAFPAVTSKLDTLRADATWTLTKRTDLVFSWWHEKLKTSDWAIQGIEPSTLPTVLALGYDPYNYNVDYVTASVRYYFKPRGGDE